MASMRDYDTKKKPSVSVDLLGFMVRLTLPLLVIATGVFFFFAQRDNSMYSTNWWVMYLVIVGIMSVIAAVFGYLRQSAWTAGMTGFAVLGVVLLLLSLIFIADPTWSFTRDWNLFRGVNWDAIWPIAIILVGLALLIPTVFRRSE